MSRIGKKPILIPEGVVFSEKDGLVKLTGPLGEIEVRLPDSLRISRDGSLLKIEPKSSSRQTKSFHGLFRSLLANAVIGVKEGFEKELEIRGIGLKASKEGEELILQVGLSHPVKVSPPSQIQFEVLKNIIKIKGIDKQKVGEIAAGIRKIKPPTVYKGKGIRYKGEEVKLKPGKTVKTGTGTIGSSQGK